MNINNVDLNLLRVFEAIYSHGTLTRAAEALYITQPAVSHALARLRDLYNDPLFSRTADGMTPTPLSNEIVTDIHDALRLIRSSVDRTEKFDPKISDRHFRFSMGDLVESMILPKIMKTLQREAPNSSVEIFHYDRHNTVRHLVSSQLDFAIDSILPGNASIFHSKIFEDDFVCAVRKNHPTIKGKISLEQYLKMGHIHATSRKGGLGHVDMGLRDVGVERKIVFRTPHYLNTPNVVAKTDLILSTTRSLARAYNLRIIPLPFEVMPLELCLYWYKESDIDRASVWLRNRILQLFPVRTGENREPASTLKTKAS